MRDDIQNSSSEFQLPEVGQLVNVRRRQWLVANVNSSSLNIKQRKHTFVSLSSIDDDALGEEIEIVWEIEPGAKF